jgi:aminoglycoside phosphotransferase family enzyme/predicted kinase
MRGIARGARDVHDERVTSASARGGDTGQARIVTTLADPQTHGVEHVEHVQTHISHVFLAGDYVYKLKKSVAFAFLDFTTLAAREHFCREEVLLNRRLAAPIYLDVLPMTDDGGVPRLGGAGTAIDWVVRMRRLPADRVLLALLARGAVDAPLLARLAALLARFHTAAARGPGGGPEGLMAAWRENLDGIDAMVGRLLAREDAEILADFGPTYVVRHDAVLRARVALGHVRDGHGDLRLDHVYALDDALPALPDAPAVPAGLYVVDCLEFSPALRSIDVAADLSFLAMELEAQGRRDLARTLTDAYAEASDDTLVPSLVPFHACHRAAVRGKVEGLTSLDAAIETAARTTARERARRHFALAGRLAWRSGDPVVVVCMGLSGTGKSAVAARIAEATGFTVAASDMIRRETAPPGAARYTAAARAAVYDQIRRRIDAALAARENIVVDATFVARSERDRLARTVAGYGARHVFVECVADEATVCTRLGTRDVRSISDARIAEYLAQRQAQEPLGADEPALRLDTGRDLAVVRADLVRRLWAWRQGRPIPRAP